MEHAATGDQSEGMFAPQQPPGVGPIRKQQDAKDAWRGGQERRRRIAAMPPPASPGVLQLFTFRCQRAREGKFAGWLWGYFYEASTRLFNCRAIRGPLIGKVQQQTRKASVKSKASSLHHRRPRKRTRAVPQQTVAAVFAGSSALLCSGCKG